jgi:hypothetical protein
MFAEDVGSHVGLDGKALVAMRANVRLLARVRPHVNDHVAAVRRNVPALSAEVPFRGGVREGASLPNVDRASFPKYQRLRGGHKEK